MSESDAVRFRNQAEKTTVAVKTPRPSLLDDLKTRFVVAVKQQISGAPSGVFISQFERFGTEPLHVNDSDEAIRKNSFD